MALVYLNLGYEADGNHAAPTPNVKPGEGCYIGVLGLSTSCGRPITSFHASIVVLRPLLRANERRARIAASDPGSADHL